MWPDAYSTQSAPPPLAPWRDVARSCLPPLGFSKTRLARALGLSRYQLSQILAEKRPVTPVTSLKLEIRGRRIGASVNMQTAYDQGRRRAD